MDDIAIHLEKVSKSFGKHEVLKEINLSVHAGEYMGLIGVNGVGKTTMMKCLLNFCAIDSGSITIFGVSHINTNARERLIFLPEKFIPPYYLTGRDFLVYMSELQGNDYDERKVGELLKILDLEKSALSKSVRQYSKGMGQKLGLIACLLSDTDLLIFDEPMSGLDPKARASLKQYLIELKQNNKALFFSTHILADVETLCDRIAILHDHGIHFLGAPDECCKAFGTDDLEHAFLACVGT